MPDSLPIARLVFRTRLAFRTRIRAFLPHAGFPTALLAYLFVVAVSRFVLARSLMYDESEQLALSSVFALGYGAQSPLIIWITWAATKLFGPSVAVVVGVRMMVLAVMFTSLYICARLIVSSANRALLATAAALFIPAVCWDFMVDKMHTPPTCTAAIVTVALLVRAVHGGELRWAIAVGIAVGLGPLCKYTYVPFAAGLLFAALTVESYRRWLLSRRGAIAAVVAMIVLAPHAVWVVANKEFLASGVARTMVGRSNGIGAFAISLADAVFLGFVPLLVVFALAVPKIFRQLELATCRPQSRASRPLQLPNDSPPAVRVLGRALLIAALLCIAVVAISGGNRFKAHWITPLAVLLPILLVARLDQLELAACRGQNPASQLLQFSIPKWRIAALWVTVGMTLAGTAIASVMIGYTDWMKEGRSLHARDRLAEDEAAILTAEQPDAIVCDAVRHAGNARVACPQAAVAVLGLPPESRAKVSGKAILVWEPGVSDAIPERVTRTLAREYRLRPDPTRPTRFIGTRWSPEHHHARSLGITHLVTVEEAAR